MKMFRFAVVFLALSLSSISAKADHDDLTGMVSSSTWALFGTVAIKATMEHKELIYVGAADEAAAYLQVGGEPSALLREAMDTERSVCVLAGIQGADQFSDELLAELVVARASSLINK